LLGLQILLGADVDEYTRGEECVRVINEESSELLGVRRILQAIEECMDFNQAGIDCR
jgi:hypothetical protein